jgi:hypothetical protein
MEMILRAGFDRQNSSTLGLLTLGIAQIQEIVTGQKGTFPGKVVKLPVQDKK